MTKLRLFAVQAGVLASIAGCLASAPGASVSPDVGTAPGSTAAGTRVAESPAPSATPEVIGGLAFRAPEVADLHELVNAPIGRGPLPRVQGNIWASSRLQSGNYSFEAEFPCALDGDARAVALVRAARTSVPVKGKEAAFVSAVVLPLVSAWAGDARLFLAYSFAPDPGGSGAPPFDLGALQNESSVLRLVGWPLIYLSAAKREELFVYDSGMVLRVGWAPATDTATSVPVTRSAAIARTLATLRDPAAKSEEEVTGLDHFLGVPYGGMASPPLAVPATTLPDTGPAFDFPDVSWDATFEEDYVGKPVWRVAATQGYGFGSALVDARTGAIVRFQRTSERYQARTDGPVPAPSP